MTAQDTGTPPAGETAATDLLRAICLALPEAEEKLTWGAATYRVRDKIFAMESTPESPDHRGLALWCKAAPGSQEILVGADPDRFFIPPYVGPKGWVGMLIDDLVPNDPTWADAKALVERSYRLIAPKRLVARLP